MPDEVLKMLNDDYMKILSGVKTIQETYYEMILKYCYRLLSRFEYNWEPILLRSNRLNIVPSETEVMEYV